MHLAGDVNRFPGNCLGTYCRADPNQKNLWAILQESLLKIARRLCAEQLLGRVRATQGLQGPGVYTFMIDTRRVFRCASMASGPPSEP